MEQVIKIFQKVLLTALVLFASKAVFSQGKAAVDYRAKETRLVEVADSSVVKLIGDVFLIHNGAIISCDSAYRYSERRFEAYGNVIINQDSLYIYGDKVVYNGLTDVANVISELIKVVDNDVTMYTREMYFNTKTKVGYFSKGATVRQGESLLEADNGSYDTENKLVTLNNRVAMENEEYILKSNALDYNQNSKVAFFETLTNIWNKKGEYLQADKGKYEQTDNIYHFEKNSYILTEEQEAWSDSLIYYSNINEVELKRNIQIDDTVQKAKSFGDYAYFWNRSKRVLLTRTPSVMTYDEVQRDSSYISADTIVVAPILERSNITGELLTTDTLSIATDSLIVDKTIANEQIVANDSISKEQDARNRKVSDLVDSAKAAIVEEEDSANQEEEKDKVMVTTKEELATLDTLPPAERRDALLKRNNLPNFIPLYSDSILAQMDEKSLRRATKRMARYEKKFDKELNRYISDILFLQRLERDKEVADSVAAAQEPKEVEEEVVESTPEIENIADSSDMIITAFLNAKVFRRDMQSIADTMVVETVDSTTTSIGKPIAWNMGSQITAGRIRSYVSNGEINRTRMFTQPMMVQKVEEEMFNQMKGKTMDALYRNGEMYRLIVTDDAIGRMYREEPDEVSDFMQIVAFITSTSTNMIIDMDSSIIKRVKWVGKTTTNTYPMEDVPADMKEIEGFEWMPELRPYKQQVFNRRIRKSIREKSMKIKKPDFAITKQIMEDRNRLISSGVWIDRNDKLKVNREELIRQSEMKVIE